MTTGLTDPADDFYQRFPELEDLDRAVETSRAQLADMVDDHYRRKLDLDEIQSMGEMCIDPGHVFMTVDTPAGLDLLLLGTVDRFLFDPDAAEDTR